MAENMGLTPGTVLNRIYRIDRIIGQGGFGITYLAYDMQLDRLVAIKEFFPKDYCEREGATSQVSIGLENTRGVVDHLKDKFITEARNIAKFNHPGIIKIYSAFEENQTAYYVMEYIKGKNLQEIVKGKGPLALEDSLRYIKAVGEALRYVHEHNTNHFDVKPANILIRESDDHPILIDFGLSKRYEGETAEATTTIIGMSQGYAPFEQYSTGGVKGFSPQTDIYALGATLYYILSGKVPPEAPKLIDQELTFPVQIPERLIKPISKAMSSARVKRQPSVESFIGELEEADNNRIKNYFNRMPYWLWPAVEVIGIVFIVVGMAGVSRCTNSVGPEIDGLGIDSLGIDSIDTVSDESTTLESYEVGPLIDSPNVAAPEDVQDEIVEVKDMVWYSPLGKALYTGTVLKKGDTGEEIPTNKGIAEILDGTLKGCIYEGEIENGELHGKARYTLPNGDIFDGTFSHNQFERGRYSKSTGIYFEGTYKDGKPHQGSWYDKDGFKIEE